MWGSGEEGGEGRGEGGRKWNSLELLRRVFFFCVAAPRHAFAKMGGTRESRMRTGCGMGKGEIALPSSDYFFLHSLAVTFLHGRSFTRSQNHTFAG